MHVAALIIELRLPGCNSLKEKRGRLKPLLAALHREFNIAAAEIEHQDAHGLATIACAAVSNDPAHVHQVLDGIPNWIDSRRPDIDVIDQSWSNW